MSEEMKEMPLSEKYTLSVDEAALYFGIGQKKLRRLISFNPNADYLIMIGQRVAFKRRKFEQFIDDATCI